MLLEYLAQLAGPVIFVEILLIIGRVAISWFPGVNRGSALVVWLYRLTEPVLAPCRRILPTFGGLDLSPILAIILLQTISTLISDLAYGGKSPAAIVLGAIGQLIISIIGILALIVLVRFVVSLLRVDPYHPVTSMIRSVSDPLVRPFSGVGGRAGALDVPALVAPVAFVALYFLTRTAYGVLLQNVP
jgi:YggT family protein